MSGTTSGTGATPPTITPPTITPPTITPPTITATTTATPSTTIETTSSDTAAIPAGTGPETGATGAGSDTTAAMPTTAGTDDGAATPTPTAGADGTGTAAGTPTTAGGATTAQVPADPFEAQVTRLYDTVFDRAPDSEGLAFWSNALRGGTALGAVADGFVASPEAQGRYGGLGDAGFVDAIYRNALDREADPAGRDFWAGALQRGFDRGDVAQAISEAPEHAAKPALTFGGDDPLV